MCSFETGGQTNRLGNKGKGIFLTAACLLALPFMAAPAAAGDYDSESTLYFSLAGGGTHPESIDTFNIINPNSDEELDLDIGYAVVGAIGGRVSPNTRVEFETGWRSYDADQINDPAFFAISFPLDGSVDIMNAGVNVFYDFNVNSAFQPYIGIGVGAAHFEANNIHREGEPDANQWQAKDWAFYYQAIVGLTFLQQENFEFFGEYRYMGTAGLEAQSSFGVFVPEYNTERFHNHTVLIGGRIKAKAL